MVSLRRTGSGCRTVSGLMFLVVVFGHVVGESADRVGPSEGDCRTAALQFSRLNFPQDMHIPYVKISGKKMMAAGFLI